SWFPAGNANLPIGVVSNLLNDASIPRIRATPTPTLSRDNEARLHRIQVNMLNRLLEVSLVTDMPIPIFPVPDRSARPLAAIPPVIANLAGRELLPRSHDLRDCPSRNRLEKDMRVIRHYDPRQQPVMLRIKRQQRSLHHVGDA